MSKICLSRYKLIKLALFTIMLCTGGRGFCLENDSVSPFVTHHFGSYQGAYAIGFGYRLNKAQYAMSLGYTPAFLTGFAITQINLKLDYKIRSSANFDFLSGIALLLSGEPSSWRHLSKRYLDPVNSLNAYFFAPYVSLRHNGFYLELAITDYYLAVLLNNHLGKVSLIELFSFGVGYTVPL